MTFPFVLYTFDFIPFLLYTNCIILLVVSAVKRLIDLYYFCSVCLTKVLCACLLLCSLWYVLDNHCFWCDFYILLVFQYLEDNELTDLLEELINMASSSWHSRHGAMLTISSMLRHKPSAVCQFAMFSSILGCLKSALKDEKVLFCHCLCMYD